MSTPNGTPYGVPDELSGNVPMSSHHGAAKGAAIGGRVLAVDPGERRIGTALSDPGGIIANPLLVIQHVSRLVDAGQVAALARQHQVVMIVVGQALGSDGEDTPQARKAQRFAETLRSQIDIPVVLWDESGSTQAARSARISMGVKRNQRRGHLDEIAATVILQSFLDSYSSKQG